MMFVLFRAWIPSFTEILCELPSLTQHISTIRASWDLLMIKISFTFSFVKVKHLKLYCFQLYSWFCSIFKLKTLKWLSENAFCSLYCFCLGMIQRNFQVVYQPRLIYRRLFYDCWIIQAYSRSCGVHELRQVRLLQSRQGLQEWSRRNQKSQCKMDVVLKGKTQLFCARQLSFLLWWNSRHFKFNKGEWQMWLLGSS